MRRRPAIICAQFEHGRAVGIFCRVLEFELRAWGRNRSGQKAASQTKRARAHGALRKRVGAQGNKQTVYDFHRPPVREFPARTENAKPGTDTPKRSRAGVSLAGIRAACTILLGLPKFVARATMRGTVTSARQVRERIKDRIVAKARDDSPGLRKLRGRSRRQSSKDPFPAASASEPA